MSCELKKGVEKGVWNSPASDSCVVSDASKVPDTFFNAHISADSAGLSVDSVRNSKNVLSAQAKLTMTVTMALPTTGGCPKVTPAAIMQMLAYVCDETSKHIGWILRN